MGSTSIADLLTAATTTVVIGGGIILCAHRMQATPVAMRTGSLPTVPVGATEETVNLEVEEHFVKKYFRVGWITYWRGPQNWPDAVAYAQRRNDCWWVVVIWHHPERAAAYVTAPYTHDPLDPASVLWSWSGKSVVPVVEQLETASATFLAAQEPQPLPDSLRMPDTYPHGYRPARGRP
ncbi:MAG TPA: hypothetical protein VFW65_32175 [Pseudonocardiaceae bacterium]|nr:hypothetical protein [Pseudonocardiaceae bacterium]